MSRDRGKGVDRRDFVCRAAGLVASAALGLPRSVQAAGSPIHDSRFTIHALSPIGVQLYTVRRAMQESVERTLEQVARIGYKEVEFAGYFGRPAKDIRTLLEANGLTAPSAHSADMNSVRTRFAQVLEDARVVGHRYVICASPPRMEQTVDGYKALAEEFNRAGAEAAKAGVTFGFHNHGGELSPLGGTSGYDILLAECDPKLVTMQMDLFWTRKAGRDPLEFFAKHPGRFSSVHVKDMDAAGTMVDVGAGQLPFGQYFAQAKQAGIQHYFVEHDSPADPMGSITASYRHLAALSY